MTAVTPRIPTFIVTGFLGSGKTTLLRDVLHDAAFRNTAVIVNEFGAVGLDHELMAHASERTIVMPGGCVCCTIRQDVETTLKDLLESVESGKLAPFDRLVIETTGLADPAPLLFTLHASPLAANRLQVEAIITTVDAVLGAATLDLHPECEKQIAAADRIVITKCDLAKDADLESLEAKVRQKNPWAEIDRRNPLWHRPIGLFTGNLHDARANAGAAEDWVVGRLRPKRNADLRNPDSGETADTRGPFLCEPMDQTPMQRHAVRSFCITYDHPTDWTGFGVWLTLTLHRYGAQILRIKGLLGVEGLPGPVVIHGVQHMIHPPVHLDTWPSSDHRSRLVLIVRGLDPALVERSLRAFTQPRKSTENKAVHYRAGGAGGMVGGRPIRRPTAPGWIKG